MKKIFTIIFCLVCVLAYSQTDTTYKVIRVVETNETIKPTNILFQFNDSTKVYPVYKDTAGYYYIYVTQKRRYKCYIRSIT
jgi:hypothetical protein